MYVIEMVLHGSVHCMMTRWQMHHLSPSCCFLLVSCGAYLGCTSLPRGAAGVTCRRGPYTLARRASCNVSLMQKVSQMVRAIWHNRAENVAIVQKSYGRGAVVPHTLTPPSQTVCYTPCGGAKATPAWTVEQSTGSHIDKAAHIQGFTILAPLHAERKYLLLTSTGRRLLLASGRHTSTIRPSSFASTHGAPAKEVHNGQEDDRTEQGDEERWQAQMVLVDSANA